MLPGLTRRPAPNSRHHFGPRPARAPRSRGARARPWKYFRKYFRKYFHSRAPCAARRMAAPTPRYGAHAGVPAARTPGIKRWLRRAASPTLQPSATRDRLCTRGGSETGCARFCACSFRGAGRPAPCDSTFSRASAASSRRDRVRHRHVEQLRVGARTSSTPREEIPRARAQRAQAPGGYACPEAPGRLQRVRKGGYRHSPSHQPEASSRAGRTASLAAIGPFPRPAELDFRGVHVVGGRRHGFVHFW